MDNLESTAAKTSGGSDASSAMTKPGQSEIAPRPRQAAPASGRRDGAPAVRWRLIVAWLIVGMAVGGVLGALLMRQRERAKQVVASVDGKAIRSDEFYHRLERAAGERVLRDMAQEEMLQEFAQKRGILPTPAAVTERYSEVKKQPNFDKLLDNQGWTEDEFKHALQIEMLKQALLTNNIPVTDAEVKRYYDENIDHSNVNARFYTPEVAQVAVIVTKSADKANKALEMMRNGSSWATAASEYSEDASRKRGGVMPPVVRGRSRLSRVPDLEAMIFGLKIGGLEGPKQFLGYWWIVKCLERRPAITKDFAKVKEDARLGAQLKKRSLKQNDQLKQDFEQFQKSANVQAFWKRYTNAVNFK